MTPGTDYYYEVDGTGAVHTGGTAFSSESGKTYNFGQQPFASQFDTSQVWSSTLTASTSFEPGKGADKAFNGILDDQAQTTGADSYMEWDVSSYGFTGIVTWWVGGTTEVYYDGTKVAGGSGTGYNPKVASLPIDGISVVKFARPTANSYPLVSGVEVDGKILVDTNAAIVEAYGNNLFQTWLEWNDVAVLLANNPANVATYEAIKEALETYEGDKVSFQRNLRARMLQAGFGIADVVSLGLVDDTENATSINGYYPLYSTMKAAEDAGSGAAHSHIIDGVTYYMPDAGVTIYHGDYVDPDASADDSGDTTSDSTDSDDSGSTDSGSSSSGGSYGY